MRALVTGRGGQLSSEFEYLKKNDNSWVFKGIDELNIVDLDNLNNYFSKNSFDLIINCAAYTSVDEAEKNKNISFSVNFEGTKNLVKICKRYNIKLIHFSTDYVFNGFSDIPYKELDYADPQTVYGLSKREGEKIINKSDIKSITIRTSWVYSSFGNNFVKTMLKLAGSNNVLKIVDVLHLSQIDL